MKLIETRDQLMRNVEMVEHYLAVGTADEQKEVYDLIRKGKNVLAYEVEKEMRFAPSRFLGYIDNTIAKHNDAKGRDAVDGRETTPVISKILEQKLSESNALDEKFIFYCKNLGLTPSNSKRTFWNISLARDFKDNELLEGGFPEGRIFERIHKTRERSSKVIETAKANYKKVHGKLFCQICGFDYEETYGDLGKDFIEGHHTIAISEMKGGYVTKPEEIALLCANCHRMVHKKRPWQTMDKLKSLINLRK